MAKFLPPGSPTAWTALLAVLAAALLLIWPGPGQAQKASPPPAEASELAERSRALERARRAVLGVQATAIEEARSARTLGRERGGSGVLISDDGLVLTIGYLVLEAEDVVLTLDDGRTLPARVRGYDVATGFGLVQALAPLAPFGIEPVRLGPSEALAEGEPLMVATGGAGGGVGVTRLLVRRPFSGYWEYHLDQALLTAPPSRNHSGAGLFNGRGELLGIGSLFLADAWAEDRHKPTTPANLFVPAELLAPILAELRERGRSAASQRAWLGLNCVESDGQLRVMRVTDDSPADVAGLEAGDQIEAIDGQPVATLGALWKALWAGGPAEREVALAIRRDGAAQTLKVHSVDRQKTLRRPQGI
ncbi:MAG: serine protease [Burkholderiaceae bacterium]|nr:serine protease [Burkholderiaceae bacterium]